MGSVFDNNIPSKSLKDFKREFKYKGSSWSDTDRRGEFESEFSPQRIRASKRLEDAKKLGERSSIRSPFNSETVQYEVGGWFDSYARGLERDFNDNYRSNYQRPGDNERTSEFSGDPGNSGRTYNKGTRTSYNKGGWFDSYKKNVSKSHIGAYHENYSRNDSKRENSYTKDTDVLKLNTHRPDNIHYGARPISKNEITGDSSEIVDDNLGELVKDFDRTIDRTKPSDIYLKVDEAIELAEKLEASKASKADQVENLEALISVFEFMDELINRDVLNLAAIRDADKGNRGKDTGKQTDVEKNAVSQMMTRTSKRAELTQKRQDLNEQLVLKKTFKR
jgi:hypothetical protein